MDSGSVTRRSEMADLLFEMTDSDRDVVLEALGDDKVSTRDIWRILNKNGHPVSYDSVRRFRNKSVNIPPGLEF